MLNIKDFYRNQGYNTRREYLSKNPRINQTLAQSSKKIILESDISNKTVFFEKSIKLDRLSLKSRTDFKYTSNINKADVIVLNRTNYPDIELRSWGSPLHIELAQFILNNPNRIIHIMYFQDYLNKYEKLENSDVELTPEFVNNFNNMVISKNIIGAITFLEVLDNTTFSHNLNNAIYNTVNNYIKPISPNLVLYTTRVSKLLSKYKPDNKKVFYTHLNRVYKEHIEDKESLNILYKEIHYMDYFNNVNKNNISSINAYLNNFNSYVTKHFSNENN
jgi:hypothetical protein